MNDYKTDDKKNTCRRVVDALPAYIESTPASAKEYAWVAAHIEDCSRCRPTIAPRPGDWSLETQDA